MASVNSEINTVELWKKPTQNHCGIGTCSLGARSGLGESQRCCSALLCVTQTLKAGQDQRELPGPFSSACSLCCLGQVLPHPQSPSTASSGSLFQCSSGDFSECLRHVGLSACYCSSPWSVVTKLDLVIYMKSYQNAEWHWYLLLLWAVPWHHSELFICFFLALSITTLRVALWSALTSTFLLPKPHLGHPLYVQSGVLA